MRLSLVALLLVLVPAVATATSPAICADQEINLVEETTIGVGCPIYAVNPTTQVAALGAQINGAAQQVSVEPTSVVPFTVVVSTTRCNSDVCEEETTLTPRVGELLRYDLPELQVGDTVLLYPTLEGEWNAGYRLTVTDEACRAAPTTFTVTACTGLCEYVEQCDAPFGCAAGPAHGARSSWAFPLLALGVVMAWRARASKRR